MGWGKDIWIDQFERILDAYPTDITRDEAVEQLQALGLDPHEIDDNLNAVEE